MVNKVNGIKVKKNPLVEIFGRGGKEITFQAINYFLFFLFGLATLYPFIYVVKVSMESIKLVNGLPVTVYNFSAYGMVLQNAKIYKSFFLTVGIVAAHTLLHLFFTFISAYPLSKKPFQAIFTHKRFKRGDYVFGPVRVYRAIVNSNDPMRIFGVKPYRRFFAVLRYGKLKFVSVPPRVFTPNGFGNFRFYPRDFMKTIFNVFSFYL